jgi:hypothetical protein
MVSFVISGRTGTLDAIGFSAVTTWVPGGEPPSIGYSSLTRPADCRHL